MFKKHVLLLVFSLQNVLCLHFISGMGVFFIVLSLGQENGVKTFEHLSIWRPKGTNFNAVQYNIAFFPLMLALLQAEFK